MNETIKGTFSFGGWQRRLFRAAIVTAGYWLGLNSITPEIGWAEFGAIISTPFAVLGWFIAVTGAVTSSGYNSPAK